MNTCKWPICTLPKCPMCAAMDARFDTVVSRSLPPVVAATDEAQVMAQFLAHYEPQS